MGITTSSDVEARINSAHERAWGKDGGGFMERCYPSTASLEESDFLTAEEAAEQAKKQAINYLGEPGVPKDDVPWHDDLNDDVPNFLHASAKAGPSLDHLGRTPKERKERKIKDAIALGEKSQLPAIVANDQPSLPLHRRVVTFTRDHDLDYPDLYLAVYVAPDWDVSDDEARFARLFARSGCYRAESIDEADLIVFGGGSDIEPLLYGESNENRHPQTFFNADRDAADMQIYLKARAEGVAMMGVCRGAQFLHVMNGGKLYQHIDGHYGHHKAFALKEKLMIERVSSVHHQSCIFDKDLGMEVLLTTSSVSSQRWLNADVKDSKPKIDIEGFFYRDTGCFGVQGHPEYSGCNRYSVWCLEKINDLFLCSPDFSWDGKRLRMTKEARDAAAMGKSFNDDPKKIAADYVENAYNQAKEA